MAMRLSVGFLGVPRVLQRNREYANNVRLKAEQALERAAQETAAAAKERVPVNIGYLRNSITVERPAPLTREVHTGNAPYGAYVEFGTSPHWPPIEPLKRWAHRKLGDERLAYPVARRIAAAGTAEQPYMRPAFEEVAPKLRRELQNIARQVR